MEAPAEQGALSLYLFANFAAESGAELAAGALNLEPYLIAVDPDADAKDRSVTLPVLDEADLGGATPPPDADPDAQVPLAVTAYSDHDLDGALTLVTDPNQVCIANDGYKYYRREFTTDPGCFVDGSCAWIDATAEVRYESFLADVWFDETQQFRRVALGDGRTVVFQRGWTERSYLTDRELASWDQRFTLNVYLPDADDPGRTHRYLAFWSSVTVPGIGDDAYANLVLDSIADGFVNEDAFLAGEECSNDRDRAYDRP